MVTISIALISFLSLFETSSSSVNLPNGIQDTTTDLSKKKMLWQDEFDIPGSPNPQKWAYDLGNGPDGWGNQELQFYTDRKENVVVENGLLKVRAIREQHQGFNYTSSRLVTRGKFEFTYGTVEIRAKVPPEIGTWPAVWMLGKNIATKGWPACGEIDIIEHRGKEKNKIVTALHYPERHGQNPNKAETTVSSATTDFHVYRLDWLKETINLYIDDRLVQSVKNTSSMPYHADFYLLINMAMGGGFGGKVDPLFTESVFEIDYIRVYK